MAHSLLGDIKGARKFAWHAFITLAICVILFGVYRAVRYFAKQRKGGIEPFSHQSEGGSHSGQEEEQHSDLEEAYPDRESSRARGPVEQYYYWGDAHRRPPASSRSVHSKPPKPNTTSIQPVHSKPPKPSRQVHSKPPKSSPQVHSKPNPTSNPVFQGLFGHLLEAARIVNTYCKDHLWPCYACDYHNVVEQPYLYAQGATGNLAWQPATYELIGCRKLDCSNPLYSKVCRVPPKVAEAIGGLPLQPGKGQESCLCPNVWLQASQKCINPVEYGTYVPGC